MAMLRNGAQRTSTLPLQLLLITVVLAACGQELVDDGHTSSTQSPIMSVPVERSSKTPLRTIAEQYAEFGGYYCEEGDLVVTFTPERINVYRLQRCSPYQQSRNETLSM